MKLNSDLTELFNSPAKIKIIKYVIKPGFMMTGREVSRICGLSHSNTIQILKEFEDLNLVSGRRAGKSVVWGPRLESYAYFVAERLFGKSGMFSAVENLKLLIKDWSGLKKRGVVRVILFGSIAEGTDNLSSDIDVFVQVRDQKHKIGIEESLDKLSLQCIKLYGNTLNPYILTSKEVQGRKKSNLMNNIEKGIRIV